MTDSHGRMAQNESGADFAKRRHERLRKDKRKFGHIPLTAVRLRIEASPRHSDLWWPRQLVAVHLLVFPRRAQRRP